jgi:hypothetical protein
MPLNGSERRRAVRREPQSDEPLSRVRLRTGRELTVVNISASGALVEGLTRLVPNTHTDLHIVTRHGRVLVRTRVVRALVWQLERDKVCYRTALAFETPVDADVDPALREPSSRRERNDGESSGPALSEPSSGHRPDKGESNGYPLPAEIPGNFSAPGTGYPILDAEDRT